MTHPGSLLRRTSRVPERLGSLFSVKVAQTCYIVGRPADVYLFKGSLLLRNVSLLLKHDSLATIYYLSQCITHETYANGIIMQYSIPDGKDQASICNAMDNQLLKL